MSSIDRQLSLTGLKADDIEEPITLNKTNLYVLFKHHEKRYT